MQEQLLNQVLAKVENGEGLNSAIESLGLNLKTALLDMQENHRQEYKDAKQKQINNQSVKG